MSRSSKKGHRHAWRRLTASSVARVRSTPRSLRPCQACPACLWKVEVVDE